MVPRPAVTASPGSMFHMQILKYPPRLNESETPGVGLRRLCFNKPSSDSAAH